MPSTRRCATGSRTSRRPTTSWARRWAPIRIPRSSVTSSAGSETKPRARSLMLKDRAGQVVEAHSASAGLDYPGVAPQLAALAEAGRLEVATATDREAIAAVRTVSRAAGILAALET